MSKLVVLSAAEQVAEHLRTELLRGTWSGLMPGGDRLAEELGIGNNTVEAALKRLETEGLPVSQGRRRGRLITLPSDRVPARRLRLGILPSEKSDRRLDYVVEVEHDLEEAGHLISWAPRSMTGLGMDVRRIAAMVEKSEADAWLVFAGSREVLEWFSQRELPAFAILGRRDGLPIAGVGPDKAPAMTAAVGALSAMGHRRIVLLARKRQRLPAPGPTEQAFFDGLAAHGISPGSYNLPDWDESVDGFHVRLEALFRMTPPTALIVDEAPFFVAARHFLGRKGLRVPEDVSLVCNDADPAFSWCKPPISYIRWESGPVVKRILQWTKRVSHGRKDLRQTLIPARFVTGGSIGQAKGNG